MLSKEEKRFVKYWEEQRTGGKVKYYLLYILAGSFIAIILFYFLYSVLASPMARFNRDMIILTILAVGTVTLITVLTWNRNEKKFKSIIKREIREGQVQDDKFNDEKLV